MTKKRWTTSDIPDQSGRVTVVTGANSGIGFETARALARKRATVVIACRNATRGIRAVDAIHEDAPDAVLEFFMLDLANLQSVRHFAAAILDRFDHLDILINNAGVMMPPNRKETADGFELQFGTNHLGHFALTMLLLERLISTEGSRVVNVASAAQKLGQLDLDDLNWKKRPYRRMASYGASKVANMLFTHELQRRFAEAHSSSRCIACHPGWTRTNLLRTTPLFRLFNPLFAMPPWQGALSTLFAATSPEAVGGGYYGPNGIGTLRGYPAPAIPATISTSSTAAMRLWQLSEQMVGISSPNIQTEITF